MKTLQILFLIFSLVVFASGQNAVLSGVITDDQGAVIPKAKIELTDDAGKKFSVLTNDDGNYKIETVDGLYKIEVIAAPLQKFTVSEYRIIPYGKMQLDVALRCIGKCKSVH